MINKVQRRPNRRSYTQEEMNKFYHAVSVCSDEGTKRMEKIRKEQLWEFILIIQDANFSDPATLDALYESGCDDALICESNNILYMNFSRLSVSWNHAVESAIKDVKSAGFKNIIVC